MHHRLVGRPAQHRGELVALLALNQPQLVGGVVGQPAGHLAAAGVAQHHHVAAVEAAGQARDAGGQQAGGFFGERLGGPRVDGDGSGRTRCQPDPALAAVQATLGGSEDGAQLLASEQACEHVGGPPVGDDRQLARLDRHAGGFEFGLHAAAAPAALLAAHVLELVQHVVDAVDDVALGVEQARHAGEQDQRVGLERAAGQRGQQVVVAKADLFDRDGVVFVEHGHGLELVQLGDAVADVQVAQAVIKIGAGEQQLRGVEPVGGERLVPVGDQGPLADRRHRLLLGHVGGAGLAGQLHAAGAHRAAAYQRDLDLFLSQRRDLRRDGRDEIGVDRRLDLAAHAAGDQLRADLDHDVFRGGESGFSEGGGGHVDGRSGKDQGRIQPAGMVAAGRRPRSRAA